MPSGVANYANLGAQCQSAITTDLSFLAVGDQVRAVVFYDGHLFAYFFDFRGVKRAINNPRLVLESADDFSPGVDT